MTRVLYLKETLKNKSKRTKPFIISTQNYSQIKSGLSQIDDGKKVT